MDPPTLTLALTLTLNPDPDPSPDPSPNPSPNPNQALQRVATLLGCNLKALRFALCAKNIKAADLAPY